MSSSDKNTEAVFGSHIHIYDMQQAKEDGAPRSPIYYESRLAKLKLNDEVLPLLDDEVDELAEDEEEDQQAKSKSKWAALEAWWARNHALHSVALDIVTHFEARDARQPWQGHGCGHEPRYLRASVRCHRSTCAQTGTDDDPEKGAIKIVMTGTASDKALLRPHIYGEASQKASGRSASKTPMTR